jgi:eukaryotic-like serine/threonine-protein kinase
MPEPVPPILSPVELGMTEPITPVRGETDVRSPGGFPKWIIAGMAILLLSILMFNLRRKPDAAADLPPVTPTAQAAVRPVTPPAATAPPAVSVPSPAARPAVKGNWRVIAFTFRYREMATKKAKQLNEKWPDLGAAVFAPKGHRDYYLVALGDWMTREEAERVQRKVRRLGLPRDTYVQNYSD